MHTESTLVSPEEAVNETQPKQHLCLYTIPDLDRVIEGVYILTILGPDGKPVVWVMDSNEVDDIAGKELSVIDATFILTAMGVLKDGYLITSIFRVVEVDMSSPFPFSNDAVYCRPIVDANRKLIDYELLAKNNEGFFVNWTFGQGFVVTDSKTGEVISRLEEVTPECPHFVGKDALMLIETESNARVLYSVYGNLVGDDWNYLMGSMLAMTYGTVENFTFTTGVTSLEGTEYANKLMGDLRAAEQYTLAITNGDDDSVACIDLEPECLVFHYH